MIGMCPNRFELMQFTLQPYYPNLVQLFICLHACTNRVLAARLQNKASQPVLPHVLLIWDHVSCYVVFSVLALLLSSCITFNLKAGEFLATVWKWGTFKQCLFEYIAPLCDEVSDNRQWCCSSFVHIPHTHAFSSKCCFWILQYSTPLFPLKHAVQDQEQ